MYPTNYRIISFPSSHREYYSPSFINAPERTARSNDYQHRVTNPLHLNIYRTSDLLELLQKTEYLFQRALIIERYIDIFDLIEHQGDMGYINSDILTEAAELEKKMMSHYNYPTLQNDIDLAPMYRFHDNFSHDIGAHGCGTQCLTTKSKYPNELNRFIDTGPSFRTSPSNKTSELPDLSSHSYKYENKLGRVQTDMLDRRTKYPHLSDERTSQSKRSTSFRKEQLRNVGTDYAEFTAYPNSSHKSNLPNRSPVPEINNTKNSLKSSKFQMISNAKHDSRKNSSSRLSHSFQEHESVQNSRKSILHDVSTKSPDHAKEPYDIRHLPDHHHSSMTHFSLNNPRHNAQLPTTFSEHKSNILSSSNATQCIQKRSENDDHNKCKLDRRTESPSLSNVVEHSKEGDKLKFQFRKEGISPKVRNESMLQTDESASFQKGQRRKIEIKSAECTASKISLNSSHKTYPAIKSPTNSLKVSQVQLTPSAKDVSKINSSLRLSTSFQGHEFVQNLPKPLPDEALVKAPDCGKESYYPAKIPGDSLLSIEHSRWGDVSTPMVAVFTNVSEQSQWMSSDKNTSNGTQCIQKSNENDLINIERCTISSSEPAYMLDRVTKSQHLSDISGRSKERTEINYKNESLPQLQESTSFKKDQQRNININDFECTKSQDSLNSSRKDNASIKSPVLGDHITNSLKSFQLQLTASAIDNSEKNTSSSFKEHESLQNSSKSLCNEVVEKSRDYEKAQYLQLSMEPMSLKNPRGYCFFNSVLQILRGCVEFNEYIIKRHLHSTRDTFPRTREGRFVEDFCELYFYMMKKDKTRVDMNLNRVQRFFYESRDGDDVNKCFMLILTTINTITKTILTAENIGDNEADRKFDNWRRKNSGFIFDLFYGQMSHSTFCKVCEKVVNKTFQVFKCLPIPVLLSENGVKLDSCIELFFQPSDVDVEEAMKCDCINGSMNICSQSEITNAPRYLFVYLTRGSYYENGTKNNTFVESEEMIFIPTIQGRIPYRLISTIEHIGDNEGGHYYCKCCYEGPNWSLISDEQVTSLGTGLRGIISRNTIAFMFKCAEI